MQPFETMARQEKVTAVAKRFNVPRGALLSATVDSMIATWNSGDTSMLRKSNGEPLLSVSGAPHVAASDNGIADAILQAIGGRVGVNSEEVRAIVREELAAHPSGVKTLEIRAFDETPKNIGAQHRMFETVFVYVQCKVNVWLAGPAGSGKSRMALEIAKALDYEFFRVPCGPHMTGTQIFGYCTADGSYSQGVAHRALTTKAKGAVLLFDEFDRCNPAVAVQVNGLLDGGSVTFPNGETLSQPENVVFLVAANTFGLPTEDCPTAQRQDPATLSRFAKLHIDIDEDLERAIFGENDWVTYVQKVRAVAKRLGVHSMKVTPRASEHGVKLLAHGGISREEVEKSLLWNGVPSEDVRKVKGAL